MNRLKWILPFLSHRQLRFSLRFIYNTNPHTDWWRDKLLLACGTSDSRAEFNSCRERKCRFRVTEIINLRDRPDRGAWSLFLGAHTRLVCQSPVCTPVRTRVQLLATHSRVRHARPTHDSRRYGIKYRANKCESDRAVSNFLFFLYDRETKRNGAFKWNRIWTR